MRIKTELKTEITSPGGAGVLRCSAFCAAVLIVLLCGAKLSAEPATTTGLAAAAPAHGTTDTLEGVIILSRHGNRPPLQSNAALDRITSETWPVWSVQPGYITPRGRNIMAGMGAYYRERFVAEGLLSGNAAEDVKHTYFHTNSIQRTIQSGCALAEGMLPSTTTTVHYLTSGKDSLYYGGPVNAEMEAASIQGRVGNNGVAMAEAMDPQFQLVEKALGRPRLYSRVLYSVQVVASMVDNFMCEYCEGMPMQQVAFGRVTPDELEEMLKVLALDFDLRLRTPYLARTRMSNLVTHIRATLEQMASEKPVSGAFGDADDKVCVIVGHDTTLSSVAGLLDLDWVLPDSGRNLCPPGSAIVFELRKHGKESGTDEQGNQYVRVYYASETLLQLHENSKLSLQNPPTIAPIFVPCASSAGVMYDSPLGDFGKLVSKVTDPELVYPIDEGDSKQ